jgi:NADH-quinone oxidoreductase subunit I
MVPGTSDTEYYRGEVSGPVAEQVDWVREHRPDDPTLPPEPTGPPPEVRRVTPTSGRSAGASARKAAR